MRRSKITEYEGVGHGVALHCMWIGGENRIPAIVRPIRMPQASGICSKPINQAPSIPLAAPNVNRRFPMLIFLTSLIP